MKGIEWGAGRSTLWIAPRVAQLISVEESRTWYLRMRHKLRTLNVGNVRLILAPEGDTTQCEECEYSADYVGAASDLSPESMDFAVVDGKLRDLCALRAVELLRPGGFLLVDDCNRYLPTVCHVPIRVTEPASDLWGKLAYRLEGWTSLAFSDGVQETRVFLKPSNADFE
jgi:hypothetical protein